MNKSTGRALPSPKTGPDITVSNQGSIYLFRPLTHDTRRHLEQHCPDAQWFCGALVVEHRYAGDLAAALQGDGFVVE